jgi:(E)-4-hydroxy-3-methylbut-2-enyl-diphosphate synthase
MTYTNSLYHPHRRVTRAVRVGDVFIGGNHPILVQSMATTPTTDTDATVAQIQSLVAAGCPLVRLTVPRQADLQNLPNIRKAMHQKNIDVPLVADIHFLPSLALEACKYVDKVRINPGNFADRKRFDVREYTDQEYQLELERIAEEFSPIVREAKKRGIAMRIGTNHGSLSDRIMNRFGDTPEGMVASALEFIRIAQAENFHDLIVSMKASNPMVMIQAYRSLVQAMDQEQMDYPLHLGVTEAGDGQDGRIKSAIGIGSLLTDGLGDTIRVSLTEDPEREIPVAMALIQQCARSPLDRMQSENDFEKKYSEPSWNPLSYERRSSNAWQDRTLTIGERAPVVVRTTADAGWPSDLKPECVSVKKIPMPQPEGPVVIAQPDQGPTAWQHADGVIIGAHQQWAQPKYADKLLAQAKDKAIWVRVQNQTQASMLPDVLAAFSTHPKLGVEVRHAKLVGLARLVANVLHQEGSKVPLHLAVQTSTEESHTDMILRVSSELGGLLCDGLGDSIEVVHVNPTVSQELSFAVLQATRLRMLRADYIACPSCGRTLFNLQETTARIREKTNHLEGVKIAIMGCIVNGPGEMADADFGYVGSGPGRINLFVGKECVQRNIDQAQADEKLIDLIKAHGRWHEPPAA